MLSQASKLAVPYTLQAAGFSSWFSICINESLCLCALLRAKLHCACNTAPNALLTCLPAAIYHIITLLKITYELHSYGINTQTTYILVFMAAAKLLCMCML